MPIKKKQKAMIGAALALMGGLTAATFDTGINKTKDECKGSERWAVKILQDANSSKVDTDNAVQTSVSSLVKIKTFDAHQAKTRQPLELKTYEVECMIDTMIREGDSDFHLVLDDGTHTMIAEIPNPECHRVTSKKTISAWTQARAFITNYHKHFDNKKFRVRGVAFVDYLHGKGGQTGHADNNLELHPVLSIEEITK